MSYEKLADRTLGLFFTAGVSLKTWHQLGMLAREVAVYNRLSKYFKQIYFFTYGGAEDLEFKDHLEENITIVPCRWSSNYALYSFLLPLARRRYLSKADILKTNQMLGSWSAVLARWLYRKKLVARTGYTWSILYARENPRSWKNLLVRLAEKLAYFSCDAAVNTSEADFQYVRRRYHPRGHALIHNYVETDVFKPMSLAAPKGSIIFVGRLDAIKNLPSLFEALKGLPFTLDIVGSGPEEAELKRLAAGTGASVRFLGNIPNHELPQLLNSHELFVLPSFMEGMPKALLEAMACARAVLGTNVKGIKEVITHGENGFLCGTDPASIREAIITVLGDPVLRERLGRNARQTIVKQYSLDGAVERELEIYCRLVDNRD